MCWFSFAPKKKWNSTCWNFSFDLFLFHLLNAAHHVSTFVVLQLFIFLAKFICSLFKSKISPRFFNLCVYWCVRKLHICAMFFLHNGNSSIWGSFLGCWMMGNLVDTPKIGGREPWFPFDIPLKSTHHLPWGQGSEVFDARNALLAAKELHHLLGTPHITRGTPCFTWLSKIWLSSHDSTWQPCKMDQHFRNITRQSNFTGDG